MDFLSIFFPRRCPLCEKITPDGFPCPSCERSLPFAGNVVCLKCGRPLEDPREELCRRCKSTRHVFTRGKAVFLYRGRMRDSVLRMKFHNRREYLDFYAAAMVKVELEFLRRIRPGCIVPVPMHPRKKRKRGFDQCLLLAERISRLTRIPVAKNCVVRSRFTRPQKGLNMEERRKNLSRAFLVRRRDELCEPVLLIDDIYTTGATMDAVSLALRREGIQEIYFLVLCMD